MRPNTEIGVSIDRGLLAEVDARAHGNRSRFVTKAIRCFLRYETPENDLLAFARRVALDDRESGLSELEWLQVRLDAKAALTQGNPQRPWIA